MHAVLWIIAYCCCLCFELGAESFYSWYWYSFPITEHTFKLSASVMSQEGNTIKLQVHWNATQANVAIISNLRSVFLIRRWSELDLVGNSSGQIKVKLSLPERLRILFSSFGIHSVVCWQKGWAIQDLFVFLLKSFRNRKSKITIRKFST